MKQEMRRRYTVLVDFLGKTLGPNYEVVLQELDTDDPGIIAIANAGISGRKVGSPITDTALKIIMQREYEHSDFKINYTGLLPNGKVIRSSTMFIKDDGSLVGLLCINFDDGQFYELSEALLKLVHPDAFIRDHYTFGNISGTNSVQSFQSRGDTAEHFRSDVTGLMEDLFESVASEFSEPADSLSQEEREHFVTILYERGMFELRGSVQYAMQRLSCSQASMYRYLKRAKEALEE